MHCMIDEMCCILHHILVYKMVFFHRIVRLLTKVCLCFCVKILTEYLYIILTERITSCQQSLHIQRRFRWQRRVFYWSSHSAFFMFLIKSERSVHQPRESRRPRYEYEVWENFLLQWIIFKSVKQNLFFNRCNKTNRIECKPLHIN